MKKRGQRGTFVTPEQRAAHLAMDEAQRRAASAPTDHTTDSIPLLVEVLRERARCWERLVAAYDGVAGVSFHRHLWSAMKAAALYDHALADKIESGSSEEI